MDVVGSKVVVSVLNAGPPPSPSGRHIMARNALDSLPGATDRATTAQRPSNDRATDRATTAQRRSKRKRRKIITTQNPYRSFGPSVHGASGVLAIRMSVLSSSKSSAGTATLSAGRLAAASAFVM